MAHVKAGGKARQHSQRSGKRLGVKIYGNQAVKSGNIIVRQRGATFHAGDGTLMGKDFTITALRSGIVKFTSRAGKKIIKVLEK